MWITDNSNNYGLWSSEEYDSIIAECTTGDLCTDAEGRWARMYDAEKLVMDDAVIFPLYTQANADDDVQLSNWRRLPSMRTEPCIQKCSKI